MIAEQPESENEGPPFRPKERKDGMYDLAGPSVDASSTEDPGNDPDEPKVNIPRDSLAVEGGELAGQTVEGVEERLSGRDCETRQFGLDDVLAPATQKDKPEHGEADHGSEAGGEDDLSRTYDTPDQDQTRAEKSKPAFETRRGFTHGFGMKCIEIGRIDLERRTQRSGLFVGFRIRHVDLCMEKISV